MSDFGSGIERCGPMHELSGRASKADLRKRIAKMEAENERAWGERDRYLSALMERNTRLGKAEAERDALRDRRLPCREAEVAQARYEAAEAERDRFSAILDRGLTTMNDKQDIVGTLALRDADMAYDADLRARAEATQDDSQVAHSHHGLSGTHAHAGGSVPHSHSGCGPDQQYPAFRARAEEGSKT